MDIPQIDRDTFRTLVAQEWGENVIPRPMIIQSVEADYIFDEASKEPSTQALRAMVLNVVTISLYMDENGKPIVVFPHGGLSYRSIDSVFPGDDSPWVYMVAASIGEDLDERLFFWRYGTNDHDGNEPLPLFDIDDLSTH